MQQASDGGGVGEVGAKRAGAASVEESPAMPVDEHRELSGHADESDLNHAAVLRHHPGHPPHAAGGVEGGPLVV
jgi:hypothetical protein